MTAEEQDSLAVGEKLVEQQEQLLAGKYENAQELEKAYMELQSKLGQKGEETEAETGQKRFRASLHRPRRTSLGSESQLAPLLAEAGDLVWWGLGVLGLTAQRPGLVSACLAW